MGLLTCASQKVTYTMGPFTRAILERNNLITEMILGKFHTRVVYPPIATDIAQKQLIKQFINTFEEKSIFNELSQDTSIEQTSINSDTNYYLAIYGYVVSYRAQIASLVFQVQYWTSKTKKTESWYTLNYNIETQAVINVSSLFKNFAEVSPALEQYIQDDITQQSTINVFKPDKTTPDIDGDQLLQNFAFIPSQKKRNKFTGIRVYVSTNKWINKKTFGVANRSYVTNIPYSVIKPYLLKNTEKFFADEDISPLKDVSNLNTIFFPDLKDNF